MIVIPIIWIDYRKALRHHNGCSSYRLVNANLILYYSHFQTIAFPQYLLFSSIQLRKTSKGISITNMKVYLFMRLCVSSTSESISHTFNFSRGIERHWVSIHISISFSLLCQIEVLWHLCYGVGRPIFPVFLFWLV